MTRNKLLDLADRRAADAIAVMQSISFIAERLVKGQQFNAYESTENEDEDDDEDREMFVCIGPVTDCATLLRLTGKARADMIADALSCIAIRARAAMEASE